ncbi:MAG TPA: YCF48-related protein, partial [Bacteroidales bacterium]|nr:YCF48-related protein [Bacteroidales bacterium]
MKKLLLLLILLPINVLWAYSQWQEGNGPFGGYVQCFVKSDNYIVAGCNWNESGVFISDDSGNTWNKVTKTDKPSWMVPDFMVNQIVKRDSTDIFYIATSGEGIYKLLKTNNEWEVVNLGFRDAYKTINSVAYKGGNIFISSFYEGIYKTSDEGKTWNLVNTGLSTKDVAYLKASGDSIFAGTTDGLFVSKNMGANWTVFSTELTGKYITDIVIKDTVLCVGVFNEGTYSFSKRGVLLSKPDLRAIPKLRPLGVIDGKLYGAQSFYGLYYSDIPNIQWQSVSSPLEDQWPLCIIDCKDTLLVGVSGFGVYRSSDKGQSWKESSTGMRAFKFESIATMGSNVYAATDINGVFVSENKGTTWQRVNNGLGNKTNTSDLLINDTVIFLATNSEVYISNDKGANWKAAPDLNAMKLATNGETVYVASLDRGINSTGDNGKTWQHVNFADSSKIIWDIDARDSIILVGTNEGGTFLSENYGKTWTNITTGLENQSNTGVLIKDTMFFITGGNKGVYRSSDRGKTWELKNNGLCCIPSELKAINNIIFGTFPQTIIYSLDNGDNWNYLSNIPALSSKKSTNASEEDVIQSMGYSKDFLFVGTSHGFFYQNIKNLALAIPDVNNNSEVSLSNFPNPFAESTTIE